MPDVDTPLTDLCDLVREQLGDHGQRLEHTVDVFVTEVCRCWPEAVMAKCADQVGRPGVADTLLGAINVTMAKCRENIESKWGCHPSHQAAVDLVLKACVVEVANVYFKSVAMQEFVRQAIAVARKPRQT